MEINHTANICTVNTYTISVSIAVQYETQYIQLIALFHYVGFECYDRDMEAGFNPPKFEDELLSVRRGKIPEDAGLFPVKYENEDWEI